jgi:hypothetical protein
MLSDVREREFKIIQEEIHQKEEPQVKIFSVKGACSYKVPKIRVEAKDKTQRHLKVLLENLHGKYQLPLTSKSSLDNANSIPGRNQ